MLQRADKKAARRGTEVQAAGARNWLQQSEDSPVYEALVSEGWERGENLAVALVARRSPRSGKMAAASFVVDLACLGPKTPSCGSTSRHGTMTIGWATGCRFA